MDNIVTWTVDDKLYYGPATTHGAPGRFHRYGNYHLKRAEIGIEKNAGAEQVFVKMPDHNRFNAVYFTWETQKYGHKGVRKISVVSRRRNGQLFFNLYLTELITILEQLGSVQELQKWKMLLAAPPAGLTFLRATD
jgi:hypothetical protein